MSLPHAFKNYVRLAYFWAFVFFVVGLLFVFIPEILAEQLTQMAHLVGLSGEIHMPRDNVGYVLGLSLMALLVFITVQSARFPTRINLYQGLLISKITSTLFFLSLSFSYGTAWITCALADGFVALTLFITHYPLDLKPALFDFWRQYVGQSPFYEVWFGKIWVSPEQAFWFRYTILDGVQQQASSWAILFSGDKIWTGKNNYPLEDLPPAQSIILPPARDMMRYHQHPQVFHLAENHLDTHNALGNAGDIYWDLRFTNSGKRFTHGPEWAHALRFAKTRYDACMLDLKFSGSVTFPSHGKNQSLVFHQAPGMIGHIYGTKQADSWAWAHCNMFDKESSGKSLGAIFEGLSGRILMGKKPSIPFSSFYFFDGEVAYEFRSTQTFLNSYSRWDGNEWHFETTQNGVTLSGIVLLSPSHALVEYTDTDDSKLWCHNSKLSSLQIKLIDPKRKIEREFKATQSAAFEMVSRRRSAKEVDLL